MENGLLIPQEEDAFLKMELKINTGARIHNSS